MKTNKKDVEYGNVDVDLKDLKDSEIKVRITTMLDKDVLLRLKDNAAAIGTPYQTYLNQFLRETLLKDPGLLTRIEKIEEQVFKKEA